MVESPSEYQNGGRTSNTIKTSRQKDVNEEKKRKREDKCWEKDNQMLNTHIPYGPEMTKSPHIHVNKSFHHIKDNCVILHSPTEKGNGCYDGVNQINR